MRVGSLYRKYAVPIEILETDWMQLTRDWRKGYMKRTLASFSAFSLFRSAY